MPPAREKGSIRTRAVALQAEKDLLQPANRRRQPRTPGALAASSLGRKNLSDRGWVPRVSLFETWDSAHIANCFIRKFVA
jgi:hypothetical protein